MKKRVLLLIPTTSYRTQAFMDAAERVGADLTVCSDRANVFAGTNPTGLLTLKFGDVEASLNVVEKFSREYPVDAVVGVDEGTTVLAAKIAELLALPHNSVKAVSAARNKFEMRERLQRCGVSVPTFRRFSIEDDPFSLCREVGFPCVVKPLMLSASRGVMRANTPLELDGAVRRLRALLRQKEFECIDEARFLLVEDFIPGAEIAIEGLLTGGKFKALAVFDKPDPLDGPFFEETIYITPSRLPEHLQKEAIVCAAQATDALGLRGGPVHVELRLPASGPKVIEVAARSIGGYCSRALRFEISQPAGNHAGETELREAISLEELILRHALGQSVDSARREARASGVMMIPIPSAGTLKAIHGIDESRSVESIEDVLLVVRPGERIVPVPEGGKYLGFIFSRADSAARAEEALREAHRRLEFILTPIGKIKSSDGRTEWIEIPNEVSY